MKTINVNKLKSVGCEVKIVVADWFAKLNNKMDTDMKKIRVVGEYMIKIWKAAGMKLENVEFLWSFDEINKRAHEYWHMADICQLGMDQRKVNVLAREYYDVIKRKNKPIILSHHMLPGLLQGQEKMSKFDSSSAVFMEDEESKIKKAYYPPRIIEGNTCLEYIKYIVFPWFNEFKVERKMENGGTRVLTLMKNLLWIMQKVTCILLKSALSHALNKILQPVRDHFETDKDAKDLLKKVKLLAGLQSYKMMQELLNKL
uniref:tyrosine--tRNA ligase n=1 Tax=Tanacetum cinerariifolium TaxID=118510 RepID=A0A699J2W4_TANCI|nr:tyrosine--tRNA ligase 1, cytoplasmic-like [Tanacetum cinerariifolium]